MREDTHWTTDALLERLARAGLDVTATMLADDVRAGYLPQREMDPRGPSGGIGRYWDSWVLWRALYLYRLRARGARGQMLRVLLFLRDGWGWADVRPICVTGLRKVVRMNLSPVQRRLRRANPEAVTFLADELAAASATNLQTFLFMWGVGLFGRPLEGGSLRHFFSVMQAALVLSEDLQTNGPVEQVLPRVEHFILQSGFTWERLIVVAEDADTELADQARRRFLMELQKWRRRLRILASEDEIPLRSTNPLTLCGHWGEELAEGLRSSPGRITSAQGLAAALGTFLWLAHLERTGELEDLLGGTA
jgi:hypothetical protein